MVKNIAHSVRERLLSTSKRLGVDYQVILTRYFHERFLYRLAQSSYKGNFLPKGRHPIVRLRENPGKANLGYGL